MSIKFKSLGGGNEIGASCHYLHCDGYNFILDVGMRYEDKRRYPSLSELSKLEEIDGINDIDMFFISHAHYDHNGALPLLASRVTTKKEIVCTEYTKKFTEIQLGILKKNNGISKYSLYEDIYVDKVLEMLSVYPIEEKIEKTGYSFTLYRSGHIPGAVMTLIEVGDKKILYTGDFSDKDYPLVEKYFLPKIENIDLLIVNATNSLKKTDRWSSTWGDKEERVKDIIKRIYLDNHLNINISHISNGVELAILINNELEKSDFKRMGISIFVDEPISKMLEIIEEKDKKKFQFIEVFNENNCLKNNGIYITLKNSSRLKGVRKINLNYSLHESYEGLKELILRLNAKKTLIAHYQRKEGEYNILKEELRECNYTNCEFVINEEEYSI